MNLQKNNTMQGRKIIVCTSFREFNGDTNDKIQRMFLSGLRNQTYQNYILVPTIFGLKNVEKALDEERIPYKAFYGNAGKYRYCLSEALKNAASLVDKSESYIILWSCCDDLFEKNYFQKLMDAMTPLSCCTSLPHINYRNIEDYHKKKVWTLTYGGIDTIAFDGDIFLNPEAMAALDNYPNVGWGMTELFFSALGRVFGKKMYNIWPAKIESFSNDRKMSRETQIYFDMCIAHNATTYDAFVKRYGLKGDVFKSVLSYKTSWRYPIVRLKIFLKVNLNRAQNIFYKSFVFKSIPPRPKKFLKRIFGRKLTKFD